jgi:hypothetical protein
MGTRQTHNQQQIQLSGNKIAMLKFFSKSDDRPADVKEIRHRVVQFIKDHLRKSEGGEGGAIRSMCLYLAPTAEERHLYEAAVYANEPNRLKNEEIQRIADDYAIDLPAGWNLDISIEDKLPDASIKAAGMPVALSISSGKKAVIHKETSGVIKVMHGGAEQDTYTIKSTQGRVNIGRDRNARTTEGFGRENSIAFPSTDDNPASRFISRQHAHIDWNKELGGFMLYADEGGIPPRNKVKVQQTNGNLVRLQTTEIGHALMDGDQIVLGESVLMEFHYLKEGV